MKKIVILVSVIFSVISFSCQTIINDYNPYSIKSGKVYYNDIHEVSTADPETFETISKIRESCEYRNYGKDKNNVYYENKKIKGADPKTFSMMEQGFYKDKNFFYFKGKKIKGTNSNKEYKIINHHEKIDCRSLGDGGCIINNKSTFRM